MLYRDKKTNDIFEYVKWRDEYIFEKEPKRFVKVNEKDYGGK